MTQLDRIFGFIKACSLMDFNKHSSFRSPTWKVDPLTPSVKMVKFGLLVPSEVMDILIVEAENFSLKIGMVQGELIFIPRELP